MTTALADPADDGEDDELARQRERLMIRRTTVMFMRNAGSTWPTIAAEVGVSEATCRKDYAVVCRDINAEQPANIVARHRAVIFDIQRANYPAMMRGDKDAAQTILKALDREAKLLGLDAPTRILANVSGEEFANEAARLIARINELDPTTMKGLTRVRPENPDIIDAEAVDQPDGLPAAQGGEDGSLAGGAGPADDAADASAGHEAGRARGVQGHAGDPIDPTDLGGWSNIEDD
ncbi:Rnase E [Mycobacterium phage Imvubu]|uniref:DNA binding protein n=1 Tax=Mycobacterium phage Imvubu TaxID=2686233 RepID=A0A6B9LK26_9CAUD|nr:Rnase E [Mycobacterium phage Imvubu]QHB37809.1 DNA binding protein [Mycobacterium phage Imvubu]